jgi:4-hydroxybenzoate polyprenyltransferase
MDGMKRFGSQAYRRVRQAGQVGRAPLIGVSLYFATAGYATGSGRPWLTWTFALLICVTVAFHVAVYLLNDVVDLPFDRTEPRRAASPMVTGQLRRRTALFASLVLAALALCLAGWLGWRCALATGISIVCLFVYDGFGKRCTIPPATDLIQGIGWGALVLAGGEAGRHVGVSGRWTSLLPTIYIMLTNGIHGSLRDLQNDARHGARTTALWLGARPLSTSDGDLVSITPTLFRYALALHSAQSILILIAVQKTVHEGNLAVTYLLVAGIVQVASGWMLTMSLTQLRKSGRLNWLSGFAYIYVQSLMVGVLVEHVRGVFSSLALLALYTLPWLGSDVLRRVLRRQSGRLA